MRVEGEAGALRGAWASAVLLCLGTRKARGRVWGEGERRREGTGEADAGNGGRQHMSEFPWWTYPKLSLVWKPHVRLPSRVLSCLELHGGNPVRHMSKYCAGTSRGNSVDIMGPSDCGA